MVRLYHMCCKHVYKKIESGMDSRIELELVMLIRYCHDDKFTEIKRKNTQKEYYIKIWVALCKK